MSDIDAGSGAALVRRLHQAFNDRDRDAFLACLAEDVTWHVEGDNPSAGTYAGRGPAWEEHFGPLWPSPARVRDDEVVEHGEHVVALGEVLHNFGDGERAWRTVEVFRVADGHVAQRQAFTTGQDELDHLLTRGCPADLP